MGLVSCSVGQALREWFGVSLGQLGFRWFRVGLFVVNWFRVGLGLSFGLVEGWFRVVFGLV